MVVLKVVLRAGHLVVWMVEQKVDHWDDSKAV